MLATKGSSIDEVRIGCEWTVHGHHITQYIEYLRGLASVNREQMDSRTLEMVRIGDQLSFKMSKQI